MNQLATAEKWEKVLEVLNDMEQADVHRVWCDKASAAKVILAELQQEHERLRKAMHYCLNRDLPIHSIRTHLIRALGGNYIHEYS